MVTKENSYKREILSLVGLLQHATKVIQRGRTFVARMYATAAKVKQLHYFTRMNKEFRSDIAWWHTFIHCWNGQSMLCSTKPHSYRFTIHTDASGSWGCVAFMSGQWLQCEWPREWVPQGIIAKELVRSYLAGLKRYTTFCSQAKLKPMPTTEAILLFVTHLASQNLVCTTIKVLPCRHSECSCGCRKA